MFSCEIFEIFENAFSIEVVKNSLCRLFAILTRKYLYLGHENDKSGREGVHFRKVSTLERVS